MKRTRKKLLSAALTLALICALSLPASAATPAIRVSDATAKAGGTASVTIALENNPGVISMALEVSYDKSALTLTGVKDAGVLGTANHNPDLATSPYRLSWENDTAPSDFTANGTVVTLTFALSASANGTYPIAVSYDQDAGILNYALANVAFAVVGGSVKCEGAGAGGGAGGKNNPPAETAKHPFTDVPSGAYYENAVAWALDNGVTTGVTATTFSPNGTCTRGQVMTFLWRAAGKPEPKTKHNPFTDVSASDYYYKAILWAVEQGITKGTTATTFSPANLCQRSHVLTFLYRAQGEPTPKGASKLASGYSEGAYYKNAVAWADSGALLSGMGGGAFEVTENCPRSDAVTCLYRFFTGKQD